MTRLNTQKLLARMVGKITPSISPWVSELSVYKCQTTLIPQWRDCCFTRTGSDALCPALQKHNSTLFQRTNHRESTLPEPNLCNRFSSPVSSPGWGIWAPLPGLAGSGVTWGFSGSSDRLYPENVQNPASFSTGTQVGPAEGEILVDAEVTALGLKESGL